MVTGIEKDVKRIKRVGGTQRAQSIPCSGAHVDSSSAFRPEAWCILYANIVNTRFWPLFAPGQRVGDTVWKLRLYSNSIFRIRATCRAHYHEVAKCAFAVLNKPKLYVPDIYYARCVLNSAVMFATSFNLIRVRDDTRDKPLEIGLTTHSIVIDHKVHIPTKEKLISTIFTEIAALWDSRNVAALFPNLTTLEIKDATILMHKGRLFYKRNKVDAELASWLSLMNRLNKDRSRDNPNRERVHIVYWKPIILFNRLIDLEYRKGNNTMTVDFDKLYCMEHLTVRFVDPVYFVENSELTRPGHCDCDIELITSPKKPHCVRTIMYAPRSGGQCIPNTVQVTTEDGTRRYTLIIENGTIYTPADQQHKRFGSLPEHIQTFSRNLKRQNGSNMRGMELTIFLIAHE